MFAILKGLIHVCWSTCKWTLLMGLVGVAVAVPYMYHRLDEEIRRRVETRIAEHYPHLAVRVRSARLVEGQGIEIRGLSISEPGASGPGAELAYLDEVFLFGDTNWRRLVRNELSISQFIIRRPTIRVTRRPDGSWSAARLLPLPRLSEEPPQGTVENGVVEISDPTKSAPSTFTIRDANFKFWPDDRPSPGEPRLRAKGHLNADHLRRLDVIEASFDRAGRAWRMTGALEGMDVSPELARALPSEASRWLHRLGSLRGQVKARFAVGLDPAAEPHSDFQVDGHLSRGRIDDPRLPDPLTDLKTAFHCDPRGFVIDGLTARSGQTTVALERASGGYGPHGPLKLSATAQRLALDPKLLGLLPASWRSEWDKFLPAGEIDVDLDLEYSNRSWRPRLVVKCQNVAFSYHKFPYRLERGTGRLELQDGLLSIELKAYSEAEELRLLGKFRNPGPNALGWLEVRGNNLRLDEKLFQALSKEATRDVVRALNARGTFNAHFRCWHGPEPETILHTHLTLGLNRCSIKYDHFPYPLDDIRGTITMHDGLWVFKDLEGSNDTGRVTCQGRLVPRIGGSELALSFEADHVPLGGELRDALSPGAMRVWSELQPRGTIKKLLAILRYLPGQRKPSLWVQVEPLFEPQTSQTASIEPRCFPYRWEKLRGTLTYQDGHVKLDGLRAEHGRTQFNGQGHCQIGADGHWRLRLEGLSVDRLRADHDLVRALSGRLKKAVTDLRPSGSINLHGAIELAGGSRPGEPITSSWDLNLDFQQGRVHCGVALTDLGGGISLIGSFDGSRFDCYGELDLDSVTYKGFQFTQVRGPFWLDDAGAVFGPLADRQRRSQPERQISGRLYGGAVLGGCEISFTPTPSYNLNATLAGADLARWAQEAVAGHQQLGGQVWASIALHGQGRGLHNLSGRGNVRLRNADLYELPLMLALLKVLQGRLPDTTAFNTADVVFRIEGEHVYLDPINCQGDAVSLKGMGEMDLDRRIDLTFYALVGRGERSIPLLPELLGGASQQIMQIRVDGTLDDPVPHREVLPAVAQALQKFQAEGAKPRRGQPGSVSGGRAPRGGVVPLRQ